MSLLKKIPEVFRNRRQIWEGLKNNLIKKEHVEQVYEARLEICKGCECYDTKGDGCTISGTQPCCNEKLGGCGCSLALKLRSLSTECPKKKWGPIMSEQDEELVNQKLDAGG